MRHCVLSVYEPAGFKGLRLDVAEMEQSVMHTGYIMTYLSSFLLAKIPETAHHVANLFQKAHQMLAREALFHLPGKTDSIAQNIALAAHTPTCLNRDLWSEHSKSFVDLVPPFSLCLTVKHNPQGSRCRCSDTKHMDHIWVISQQLLLLVLNYLLNSYIQLSDDCIMSGSWIATGLLQPADSRDNWSWTVINKALLTCQHAALETIECWTRLHSVVW